MASIETLLGVLISECRKIKTMPPEERSAAWGGGPPCTLPLGEGWQIATTVDGLRAFHGIMRTVRKNSPDMADAVSPSAFDRMSRRAIGQALGEADWSLPEEQMTKAAKRAFKRELDIHRRRLERPMVHHIPVDLFFEDSPAPAFEVGPVTFRMRDDWLEAFCSGRRWKGLVEDVWSGRVNARDTGQAEAALGLDAQELIDLHEVFSVVRPARWMATVTVANCEPERSRQKASVLVGLALDVVGLVFHPDDAKMTGLAGEAKTPIRQKQLAQDICEGFMHASCLNLPGIRGKPGFAADVVAGAEDFFNGAGFLLARYLERNRPPLAERWCNALYWHSQALREPADFMAVVKHGVAMDVLCHGNDWMPIALFAAGVFGCNVNDLTATFDGRRISLKDGIETIYKEGRSKLAHGSTFGLLQEMTELRNMAQSLAHSLIRESAKPMAELLKRDAAADIDGLSEFLKMAD